MFVTTLDKKGTIPLMNFNLALLQVFLELPNGVSMLLFLLRTHFHVLLKFSSADTNKCRINYNKKNICQQNPSKCLLVSYSK